MSAIPALIGFSHKPAAGGGGGSLTNLGGEGQSNNSATHTFSSWSLATTGQTLVFVFSTSAHPTGVTARGNTGTSLGDTSTNNANGYYGSVWEVNNSGGSGNNIVVTHSAAINRIIVWAVTVDSLTYATSSFVYHIPVGSSSTITLNMTNSSGDHVAAFIGSDYNASYASSWSGATVAADAVVCSTVKEASSAINSNAGTNQTVSCTISGVPSTPDCLGMGVVYA